MRIGIDIDDTLTDTSVEIERLAHIHDSEYENKLVPNIYNMLRGSISEEITKDFYKKYFGEICGGAKIKENAKEVIDKLIEEGHEIIFITARSTSFFDDPYGFTKNYLDKNNINYKELIVGHFHKIDICKEKKIDVFFDDAVDTIERLSENGVDALLFTTKYNKDFNTNARRINNWLEVYEYLSNK